MRNFIAFITLLLAANISAHAQTTQTFQWAKSIGGALATSNNTGDEVADVATDDAGNVYVVGTYRGTVDFGGTVMTPVGSNDIFVASYDCSGALRWVKGGGSPNADEGKAITVQGGNVFVGGRYGLQSFQDSVRFADTVFRDTATAFVGRSDLFVSRFDTSGNFYWIRPNHVQDIGDGSQFISLDTDAAGNLYYAANSKPQTFPGTGYNARGFLAKYDPQGNLVRVSEVTDSPGGLNFATISCMAVDKVGNGYVGGYFLDTVTLAGDTVIGGTTSSGNIASSFIVKFDTAGNKVWIRQSYSDVPALSGLNLQESSSMELLYLSGGFRNFLTWSQDTLIRPGSTRPFVFVLDTAGNTLSYDGPQNVTANTGGVGRLKVQGNSVALPGLIRGKVTWGGITDSSHIGLSDPILYLLDTALNVQSINVLPTVGDENSILNSVAYDPDGNLYLGGIMAGNVLLPGAAAYYQGGATDGLLVKYGTSLNCGPVSAITEGPRLEGGPSLRAWPNPTEGPLQVTHAPAQSGHRLSLHDMLGRRLWSRELKYGSTETVLDLHGRPAGLYLLVLETGAGRESVKVVVGELRDSN